MENQQQQKYDGYTNRDSSFNTIDTGSGFHHSCLYFNLKDLYDSSIEYNANIIDREFENIRLSIVLYRIVTLYYWQ